MAGVVLAPVSPQIAALLHELQAQVLRDIHEANDGHGRFVPPGGTVLEPAGKAASPQQYWETKAGARIVMCEYVGGARLVLRNYRADAQYASLHPSRWYTTETRRDESGREWESSGDEHVINDFGDLVPAETRQ